MNGNFGSGRQMAMDMASTLVFVILYLTTGNLLLAAGLGMALGVAQVGVKLARRQKVEGLQWLSLLVLLLTGGAAVLTNDPRFIMFKPTVVYTIVGLAMLRRGWLERLLPPVAVEHGADVAVVLGYAWAALMLVSGALNIYVALNYDVAIWSAVMIPFGIVSKLALVLGGFGVMQLVVRRRMRVV